MWPRIEFIRNSSEDGGMGGEPDGIDAREAWLARSVARASNAFSSAQASADRLALLREWTRLSHDVLDLAASGIALSNAEIDLAPRFGLTISGDIARLDGRTSALPAELLQAMLLDSAPRRPYHESAPDAILLRWSEHRNYRCETQKAALRAVATMPPGATLMVSMPTGTGKSLLFQAAPRLWTSAGRSCLVLITPTVALALDHERTLRQTIGLEGSRALTGQLRDSERREVLDAFRRGEVPILIVSPELAFSVARAALVDAATPPDQKGAGVDAHLTGFIVDEAHIIESWGRSFRPDFQRLPALVDQLHALNPAMRTMLLSATLGPAARTVLRQAYKSDDWLEVHAGVPRFEFDLAATRVNSLEERDAILLTLIDHAPRPAIIYTNQVEHAETLATVLRSRHYDRLAVFTGALSETALRQAVIDDWAADRLDLVVATSAFGMGIDKADVRTIIHVGIPEGPARYYQEIGRAGRDGHQGIAMGVWTQTPPGKRRFVEGEKRRDDESQAAGMASGSWLSMEKAQLRWRKMRILAERQKTVRWVAGRRLAKFDIDAMHEELDGESSDYNRRWNMSLLNLLQRAEALRITEVEEQEAGALFWDAEILDDALFGDAAGHDFLWDRVSALRDAEQSEALGEFRAFLGVMSRASRAPDCVLAGIYRLIDPFALAPDCGRCVPCRRASRPPPANLHCGGADAAWSLCDVTSPFLAQGTTFVQDDDVLGGFAKIIAALDKLGIVQFIVPDGYGARCAALLAEGTGLGFVTEHRECFGYAAFEIVNLPSALFLTRDDALGKDLWGRGRAFTERFPSQTLVLVGARGLQFDGRPLPQIASGAAPYDIEVLANLAAPTSAQEQAG